MLLKDSDKHKGRKRYFSIIHLHYLHSYIHSLHKENNLRPHGSSSLHFPSEAGLSRCRQNSSSIVVSIPAASIREHNIVLCLVPTAHFAEH